MKVAYISITLGAGAGQISRLDRCSALYPV